MAVHLARTPEDLQTVAQSFFAAYPEPGVFLLEGEMGAGKTTFVRALCNVLDATGAASPTFSLVNEYRMANGLCIYHLDLYRIGSLAEALDMGVEEYLDSRHWVFVEWPDVIEPLVRDEKRITIRDVNGERHIEF